MPNPFYLVYYIGYIHLAGGAMSGWFLFFVAFGLLSLDQTQAREYTLEQILKEAREAAPELRELEAEVSHALAEARGVDAAFDTTAFAETSFLKDKSEAQSSLSGEMRNGRRSTVGVRRLFETGTSLDFSHSVERQSIEFPPPTPPQQLPDGSTVPGNDPSASQNYNPAYTHRTELKLRQSLWRNFASREIQLQESIARGAKITPAHRRHIVEQGVQAEAEQLFWSLLRLEEKIELFQDLVGKSKRFRSLTQKRTKIGRADAVDVATADAQLVAYEGSLLDLRIAAEETRKRLAIRTNSETPDKSLSLHGSLVAPTITLPVATEEEARGHARANRFDYKLLSASRAPLLAERRLADEVGKPHVNLFTSWATTGLDQSSSDSFGKARRAKEPIWSVGLELEWQLGATKSSSQRAAATAKVGKLDAQRRDIDRRVLKELALGFHALDASYKQRIQSDKHIKSLKKQLVAERRKFKQARSEEVVALRYEMEVLGAKAARIDALYNARIAEAKIRYALHAYASSLSGE